MDKATIIDGLLSLALPSVVALLTLFITSLFGDLQNWKRSTRFFFSLLLLIAAIAIFVEEGRLARSPKGTAIFEKGNELSLNYAATNRQLVLTFGGALSTRDKEVWIRNVSGSLSNLESRVAAFPFAFSDFSCTSDSKPLAIPFVVRDGSSSSFSCVASTTLSAKEATVILTPGNHEFSVQWISDSGSVSEANFCYEVDDDMANRLQTRKESSFRFLLPDCDEVSKQ